MSKYKYQADVFTLKREIQKIVGINTSVIGPDTKYYVKYKNLSYRDCRLITQNELISVPIGRNLEAELLKQPYPFRSVPFLKGLYKPTTYKFDEGFIIIEKVISDRYQNGKYQFLVKWLSLDYDECTWEDKDNDIPHKLIQKYFLQKEKFNEAYSKSLDGQIFPPNYQYLDQRRLISLYQPMVKSPKYKNMKTLSDFQLNEINLIHRNWILHQNSIISNENELEKVIQTLCFLHLLTNEYEIRGPFLILTDFSKISNWIEEIEEWTNFRVVSLTGNSQSRKVIDKYCLYYNETDHSKLIFDILIVPIENFKCESIIQKIYFMCLIVDDTGCLKDSKAELYQQYENINTDFILLMTNMSVQNGIYELWSILHFIDHKKISDFDSFETEFSGKDNMYEVIKPYLLERKELISNKNEMLIKEETIIDVEMPPFQLSLFKTIFIENRKILAQNNFKSKNAMKKILNKLMQVCNHPYLLKNAEAVLIEKVQKNKENSENESDSFEIILNSLIFASGKTIFLEKFLPKIMEGNHKIVILSQMKKILDILDDYLYLKKYKYERFDDKKNFKIGKLAIERFQTNSESCILLLSMHSGFIGLNLTEVDTVIIFDSDFNPQNDIQEQERLHSIGTKKEVTVYRLIVKNTCESFMFNYALKNLALDFANLDYKNNFSLEDQMSLIEIELMLKKCAKRIFSKKNSENEFSEETIDQILEMNTHTINLDYITHHKNVFNFEIDDQKEDADINSHDFWSQLLPHTSYFNLNGKNERNNNIHYYYYTSESSSDDNEIEENNDSDSELIFYKNENENKKRKKIINNDDFDDGLYELLFEKDVPQEPLPEINETPNKVQKQKTQIADINNFTEEQLIALRRRVENEIQYVISTKFRQALALLFNFGLYGFRFIKKSTPKEFSKLFLLTLVELAPEEKKVEYLNYIKEIKPKMLRKIELLSITSSPIKEEEMFESIIKLVAAFKAIDRNSLIVDEPNVSSNSPTLLKENLEIMKTDIAPNIKCLISFLGRKVPSVEDIFKKIKFYDSAYRVAIYISNEVLPRNFYFAPSVPFFQFPFWSVEFDFHFLCGTVIYGMMNMEHVFADPKLPFSLINQEIFPRITILRDKFQLILDEVSFLIPKDYEIKGKLINDYALFKMNNWSLLNKTVISWNFKKQIIRGLYFYGIPIYNNTSSEINASIIEKLKSIFHTTEIENFTFTLFISAVLSYCKKFQPNLDLGPFNIPVRVVVQKFQKKTKSIKRIDFIEPRKEQLEQQRNPKIHEYDLRWMNEEKIKDLAKNLMIFQKVRCYYNYFNKKVVIDMNNMPNLITKPVFNFPKWHHHSEFIQQDWNNNADIRLFNITAMYGFLLFSELGKAFMNLSEQSLAIWRLNEITSIRPIRPNFAVKIDCLFPSDAKIERLEMILNTIQKEIDKENSSDVIYIKNI